MSSPSDSAVKDRARFNESTTSHGASQDLQWHLQAALVPETTAQPVCGFKTDLAACETLLPQGVTDKMRKTAVPLVQEEEAAESPAESPSRLPARKGRGEKGAKAAAGAPCSLASVPGAPKLACVTDQWLGLAKLVSPSSPC